LRCSSAVASPALAFCRNAIAFVPGDWVFRFFPYFSRDKVRYMLRFNQISFGMGLGYMYLWCHAPFEGAHYGHEYKSPLYRYVENSLFKSGQLEENLRIKAHSFYPHTEEE